MPTPCSRAAPDPAEIVLIAGARPNFMKLAPVMRELAHRGQVRATLVHTGQHYGHDMSGVFFEQLRMPSPDVNLEVGSASHGVQTGRIMAAFEAYLAARPAPRGVIVVGDVNSTMACALVAVKRGLPVAHVEAGLRSFDREMPEEINRIVTDAVSDLLLVSEPAGLENLAREGVPAARVRYCGNVMIDSLVDQLPAARALEMPARLGVARGGYAVATLHRPSNVDAPERLHELVALLQRVGGVLPVVFPVHPRTDKMLCELGLESALTRDGRIRSIPALGYREFLGLVESARLVITDSGGIQEETTYLGVPCITLRANTERPVTVSQGTNTLAGDDLERAWGICAARLDGPPRPARPIDGWDGRAAARVVDALATAWHLGEGGAGA